MGCISATTLSLIKGNNPNKIPKKIINRLYDSIARIEFKIKNQDKISTGFFIKLNIFEKNYNFLLTCHHSISIENVDSKIDINVYYGKVENETKIKIKLDREKRFIKCYESLDSTLIQIIERDNIPENIYLLPDLNYKNGLLQYEKSLIYTGGYPNVDIHMGKRYVSAGIITKVRSTDFEYTCYTLQGSSGSPLINTKNFVIGIHYGCKKDHRSNYGTFIGSIIDSLKSDQNNYYQFNKDNQKNNISNINSNQDNYITGVINITEDDINKEVQVINSYDELKRNGNPDVKQEKYSNDDDWKRENEKEIKDNCEIQINGKNSPFAYFFSFKEVGNYQIKYNFKNNLTKLDYMFFDCSSLIDLDFSNFNTENVTNMEFMFYYCNSLTNLNILNFNTQKVTNMKSLFYKCNSLSSLNLSNFNTGNTTNMENMFSNCESLLSLNLSNFKTEKVTKMNSMFSWCDKLTYLNITNFDTQNIIDMESMFSDCHSLSSLDLQNFKTQNVTNMKSMFSNCYSLKKLNLSSFNTQNVTNMECMFNSCSSLQNLDISNFNTQNVTNMGSMFLSCKSLTNLDLSNFNTQNVINMYSMFAKCESLTEINLSNFTSEKADIDSMFEGCKSIRKIIANDSEIRNEYNIK